MLSNVISRTILHIQTFSIKEIRIRSMIDEQKERYVKVEVFFSLIEFMLSNNQDLVYLDEYHFSAQRWK